MGRIRPWFAVAVFLIIPLLVSACAPRAAPKPVATPTSAPPAPATPVAAPTPASTPPPATPALPSMLEFTTHAVGTTLHATGSGLAKVASERSPMTVVVKPTTGPIAWVPGMNAEGRPHLGILNAFELWQANTGRVTPKPLPPGSPDLKPPYKQPYENLRLLMMGTTMSGGILVREDSPIKTVADLKGKRLAWEYPAFPMNIHIGLAALTTGGVTIGEVTPVAFPEVVAGIRGLIEGRVDAAVAAVGMPIVSEADASIKVRFLPLGTDPKLVKAAQAFMPSGNVGTAGPGPAGLKVATPVWQWPNAVAASTHLPDYVAHALVRTWWDYHQELWPIHAQLKGWAPELFVQKMATVPYHPGAVRFYKERGSWTADMDRMQERLAKGELPFLD